MGFINLNFNAAGTSRPEKGEVPQRRACDHHRRAVREQYATALATLGCICRALIALGKETCCLPRGMPSPMRERSSRESLKRVRSRISVDSCCANGISTLKDVEASPKRRNACGSEKKLLWRAALVILAANLRVPLLGIISLFLAPLEVHPVSAPNTRS